MTKSNNVLRVSIKIPGKLENLDTALSKLGGVRHLAHSIRKVHSKLNQAQAMTAKAKSNEKSSKFVSQQLQKQVKNLLQFELTNDVRVPLETKKANQVLLRVSKLKNKKTGQVVYKVQKAKKLDYEFECEALADFAFG